MRFEVPWIHCNDFWKMYVCMCVCVYGVRMSVNTIAPKRNNGLGWNLAYIFRITVGRTGLFLETIWQPEVANVTYVFLGIHPILTKLTPSHPAVTLNMYTNLQINGMSGLGTIRVYTYRAPSVCVVMKGSRMAHCMCQHLCSHMFSARDRRINKHLAEKYRYVTV